MLNLHLEEIRDSTPPRGEGSIIIPDFPRMPFETFLNSGAKFRDLGADLDVLRARKGFRRVINYYFLYVNLS